MLASATFINETASGWQQVNFSTPVPITANTVYMASYHTNTGHYAGDNNYFAATGVDSAPLHALKDGVAGGNGVYAYGANGVSRNTYRSTNYWVDVVFTKRRSLVRAPSGHPALFQAWQAGHDNVPIEIGVKFFADVNGTISGIRFYKSSTNTGTHIAHLWTTDGTLLATATFIGETATGWQQADFSAPATIMASPGEHDGPALASPRSAVRGGLRVELAGSRDPRSPSCAWSASAAAA